MVDEQIVRRDITDGGVLGAMRTVARHEFVPPKYADSAYADCPISIGEGQTISQPYMVALMTQALQLKKDDIVLEIGTGSGYQTAVLACLCRHVYSVERIETLAEQAKTILDKLDYKNVTIDIGDGTLGWPGDFFFDAIIVTAAAPDFLPQDQPQEKLFGQLKEGGRMVIPIGDKMSQTLTLFKKTQGKAKVREICSCIFVPLLGKYGWE